MTRHSRPTRRFMSDAQQSKPFGERYVQAKNPSEVSTGGAAPVAKRAIQVLRKRRFKLRALQHCWQYVSTVELRGRCDAVLNHPERSVLGCSMTL
jgi:hypothetical protein